MTTWSGAPSSSSTRRMSSCASRSWMTRVLPYRFAIAMCARKLSLLGLAPVVAGAEVVQPGLADPPDPRAARRAARSPAAPPSRSASRGASLGCSATVATTPGCSSATPTPHCDDGTSTPTCTRRSTPAAAASASASATVDWATGPVVLEGDVDVGVAVQHRHRQRLGRRGERALAAFSRTHGAARFAPRHREAPDAATSFARFAHSSAISMPPPVRRSRFVHLGHTTRP